MNIFELAMFLAIAAAGFWTGRYFGQSHGAGGWIGGFVLGGGGTLCILGALDKLIDAWFRIRPLRPVCRDGKCSAQDYECLEVSSQGKAFRCSCGTRYLQRGRQFMLLDDSGSAQPYMKRKALLGRWIPESSGNSES